MSWGAELHQNSPGARRMTPLGCLELTHCHVAAQMRYDPRQACSPMLCNWLYNQSSVFIAVAPSP